VRLNGVPRARLVLDELARQWRALRDRELPDDLPAEAARFLAGLEPRAELFLVSGEAIDADQEKMIRERPLEDFDLELQVEPGAEYYPLKNLGAARARGDLLLFVDSDVLPDPGWLAHLLGSFARPDVSAVCGQTYVGAVGIMGKAFALGWTYPLRDPSGGLVERKFSGNNVAFRAEPFRRAGGFPALGGATRGAAQRLRSALGEMGLRSWQNRSAAVDHPPPSSFRHLAVRALAHGRDKYLTTTDRRSRAGLSVSIGAAGRRFRRGVSNVFRERGRVGLEAREIPAALALIGAYYGLFALGGLLTYASPSAMGRRFRV
jgi:hypothetical protein